MQTFPCGHRVVCRKCFVKTIQMVVSQRMLPLRCVICRAKVLRLKQTSAGGFPAGFVRSTSKHHRPTGIGPLFPGCPTPAPPSPLTEVFQAIQRALLTHSRTRREPMLVDASGESGFDNNGDDDQVRAAITDRLQ